MALVFGALAGADQGEPPVRRRTPIVRAVEKVQRAVVNISTEQLVVRRSYSPFRGGGDPFDRLFEEFFREHFAPGKVERKRVEQPLGSGCVITEDGLVLTNAHVIRRASNLQLSLQNGDIYQARLVAADPAHDVALVKAELDGARLDAIEMGTSSDLMLGETVIALGNTFGFENSVTSGIVSALDRTITVGDTVEYRGLIQTSALINPGNSGGPLVNVLGELVGVNAAVVSHAQGIGFAIPIDAVRDKLAPLLTSRRISKGWAGFEGESLSGRKGARVTSVHPEGPAAGVLEPGDVLAEIDGARCTDLFDIALAVKRSDAGETLRLRVLRDGKPMRAALQLVPFPEFPDDEVFVRRVGLDGQALTAALARRLRLRVAEGVLVNDVGPGGPAAEAGIEPNDVIIRIGDVDVHSPAEAGRAVKELSTGQTVRVTLVRGVYRVTTGVTLAALPPI
jgi:serine protease Do